MLTLAPTGRLDGTSVSRLADVALTRLGSFAHLHIDLRDLAEIDAAGILQMSRWPDQAMLDGVDIHVMTDTDVRAKLTAAGVTLPSGMGEPV